MKVTKSTSACLQACSHASIMVSSWMIAVSINQMVSQVDVVKQLRQRITSSCVLLLTLSTHQLLLGVMEFLKVLTLALLLLLSQARAPDGTIGWRAHRSFLWLFTRCDSLPECTGVNVMSAAFTRLLKNFSKSRYLIFYFSRAHLQVK